MKNGKSLMIVLVGVVSAGMLCTEPGVDKVEVADTVNVIDTSNVDDTIPPAPAADRAIGIWKKPMPLVPLMPETLNIALTIKQDSLFTLNLTKRISTQLYTSEGTWSATDDSIFLHSTKCMVIDTIPDPDTLKNLGDSLCSIPIPLKLPANDSVWDIETKKLAIILNGFPLPKDLLSGLITVVPTLSMKKAGTE